ncbi:hypothetical protein D8B26_000949 [Coccidioides posadasii str. Silveira]|uniref:uncharacterized protein n=1 Tax=Coccidioides posadasii (strain RMSCC 757 / Silveira) TaxID=443226 RepID=UPI001BF16920|nr:hypothetical protein D8B26_000949 [Coccidioides posadasii str. Silveira]
MLYRLSYKGSRSVHWRQRDRKSIAEAIFSPEDDGWGGRGPENAVEGRSECAGVICSAGRKVLRGPERPVMLSNFRGQLDRVLVVFIRFSTDACALLISYCFKYRIVVNFYIPLNRVKHRMRQHKKARKKIPEVSTDVVNETGLESTLARSDSELAPNTHPSSSLRAPYPLGTVCLVAAKLPELHSATRGNNACRFRETGSVHSGI